MRRHSRRSAAVGRCDGRLTTTTSAIPGTDRSARRVVSCSCTLHESTPPMTTERKVMYAPFRLAAQPGDETVGDHDPDARGEIGARLLDEGSPSSADTWAERPT